MPYISSKRSKRPLINQRIAELISGGKLPKSLWPRVHVGPGGVYLRRALICLSARGADSSSLKSSSATRVNPCRSCDPSKRLRLNSKAAALHQGPRIHTPRSARSALGLLMWKIALGGREAQKPFPFVKIIIVQRLEACIRTQVAAWTSLPLHLSPLAVDCAVALALRRVLLNKSGFVETISEQRSTFVAHQVLIEGWGGLNCCCFN